MALDLTVRYPSQIASGDSGYPYGKAQNVTVEDDGTGTPWEADLLNDHLGFLQALLAAGDVTPSGSPDRVGASDYLKALHRISGWASGWGALGDDATDDTAALQAGLDAVAARGSGRQEFHLWPGLTYRHTGLDVPDNVDIVGHGATLKITHASNNHLTWSDTTGTAHKQKLRNVRFSASTANSGACVKISATSVQLLIEETTFGNTTNVAGKYVDSSNNSAFLTLRDCVFYDGGGANATHVDFLSGVLQMANCRSQVPSTYSSSVVKISGSARVWIDTYRFLLTGHASGSMACIEVASAAAEVHIDDCSFENDTDPAASVAIKWTQAATIIERGSIFSGNITPYDGSTVLAEGSSLELRAHGSDSSTDNTYILPDDYRSFSLAGDFNTVPVVLTMPTMRYPGQPYDFQLYNADTGVDWDDVQMNALGPPVATSGDPLLKGTIRTGRFMVVRDDFQDRWYWMLIGDWSVNFGRADEIAG